MNTETKKNGVKKVRCASALLGGLLAIGLLGGCEDEGAVQVKGGAEPETTPAPSASQASTAPSVTVKDNPNQSVYSGLKLEKIDEMQHTLGGIWLDDNHIVVRKPDPNAEKVWIGETQMQPYSLYIRDLTAGEDELLHGGDGKSWGAPLLSPDGKTLFLINDSGLDGIPYLLDMDSRKLTRIKGAAGGESVSSLDAGWLDREHVVYAKQGDAGLYMADLAGTETRIAQADGKMILAGSLKAASDGRIYYGLSDTDWGMYVYDRQTGIHSLIGSPITALVPSPDDTRLAVVRRVGDAKEELQLAEPGGKEIKTLAEDKGFFGMGWSPDGKSLAYTIYSGGGSDKAGFYIADASTGESFLLSPDLADAGDQMKWSPSGNKIMATKSERVNGKLDSTTTIVTVSW
ncbi:TolB family protein [Saccharibacillus alkalitolerans]|uniref:Lipoprotein LpqB beta-propeller domain-containing protein n=1 Tax=Saccharibacillus alkalitolerans TaxID=2705290 RepID=A0ABX0FDD2_9BACL|nr:PD40 domain-containing protein [Saccharibacillus alkalitolerans]NGZ77718.1 hypothetical protein [Saccharibacillus alkalitolerans]